MSKKETNKRGRVPKALRPPKTPEKLQNFIDHCLNENERKKLLINK